jgi:TonB family protein
LAGHIERPKGIQVPNLEDFYPVEARRRGYQGTILLMARVDPDGSVGAVVVLVSSGYKILDASAMGHIAHARFGIGPRLDGKPVSAVGYEPVYYYLDNWSKAHWGGPPPPLDQKVATQLAFATAGCKHPDDCDVRGHLEGNNWVFVVSLVRVRDVEGKPLAAPGGGWVEFTIDPEGHISHKKAGD